MRRVRTTAFAICMLVAGSVSAQDAANKAAAQALFDEGQALFKEQKYEAACPKFEASLAKFDGLGTRGKLAECYEKVGKVASAWAMYREVAVLAKKAGDEKRQTVAEERAAALAPRVPYLVVNVPEANRIEGLRILRDGATVDAGAFGSKVAIDPGKHQIDASAPGKKPWSMEVTLAESAVESVEVPLLEVDPAAKDGEPKAAAASVTSDQLANDPKTQKTLGIVAVGVGAASMLVGGYFGLRASSQWNAAFDDGHCNSDTNVCDATGQDQTDSARSAATLSNIFIGAGAVVAAGGVVMWVLAGKSRNTETAAKRVRVAPVVGQRDVGVALGGTF
jgi:hypothetical protein